MSNCLEFSAFRYVWESKADGAFAISEDVWNEPLGRGTEIRLHLRDEAGEYLDEVKLKVTIKIFVQYFYAYFHTHFSSYWVLKYGWIIFFYSLELPSFYFHMHLG